MRKIIIKITISLILFAGVSAFCFGETLFNSSLSMTRIYEEFTDENYGRDLTGISFDVSFINFKGNSPFGWYFKTTIGTFVTGTEWKDDSVVSADIFSGMDIRFSAGPSFTLKTGSNLQIPILIGPVISNYREDLNKYNWDYDNCDMPFNSSDVTGYYEAITVGALCDISVVLTMFYRFTLVTGVSVNWDFLRWEKGLNAEMAFRSINSGRFNEVNYNAFKVSLYFGIGLNIDNKKGS